MNVNTAIPTTNKEWRYKLGIDDSKILVSSSMWATRSITSGKEIGIYPKGDCKFAIVNALNMSSRIKINFCVFWEPIGNNSQSDSDKKRIAYFISELPSKNFLYELKDIDQLAMWVYKKNFAIRLAKCWEAGDSTPDNPLARDLEEGLIDQWKSDEIHLQVSYFEQIWKLLRQRGRKIIKSFRQSWDCPLNSERELLEELLKESFDNEYSLLLKDCHIEKNSDIRKLATLVRKGIREGVLTADNLEKRTALRRQLGGETTWLDRLAQVCHSLAKKDSWIRSWLEIIKAHENAEAAMLQASTCDPKLREHGHGRSFACIDGKIYPNLRKLPKPM